MNVNQRILKVIGQFYKSDLSKIRLDTPIEQLNLDSLDFLALHMDIEKEFEVEISIDKFVDSTNINDLVNIVTECLTEK